jgi:hypothetical protein
MAGGGALEQVRNEKQRATLLIAEPLAFDG